VASVCLPLAGIIHCNQRVNRDLNSGTANLVQMDVSVLSGLLAKEILKTTQIISTRCSSAIQEPNPLKRRSNLPATPPNVKKLSFVEHGYHGLTMGALSLKRRRDFPRRFRPLLPGCSAIPFNDLDALEKAFKQQRCCGFCCRDLFKVKALMCRTTIICRKLNVYVKIRHIVCS